jgi:phosphate/sulfate permease
MADQTGIRDASRGERTFDRQDRALQAAIVTGQASIRFTALINGVAAVAVLIVVVAIVVSRNSLAISQANSLTSPIMLFAYGIACSGLAYACAYADRRLAAKHLADEIGPPYRNPEDYNRVFEALAVVAAVASVVLFLLGVNDVRNALAALGSIPLR